MTKMELLIEVLTEMGVEFEINPHTLDEDEVEIAFDNTDAGIFCNIKTDTARAWSNN